jgi:hypothetical protein
VIIVESILGDKVPFGFGLWSSHDEFVLQGLLSLGDTSGSVEDVSIDTEVVDWIVLLSWSPWIL